MTVRPQTRQFPLLASCSTAVLLTIVIAAAVYYCDGHLIYTLDDPYIHLAVANNILHGGYGVNLSEVSSPSSTIVWPWILALTEWMGLGSLGPLLLNGIAACAATYVAMRVLVRLGWINLEAEPVFSWIIAGITILVMSALALPMTGMEHSWHVLTVIVVIEGLITMAQGQVPRWYFLVAIILMPLLRFEGIAFAGAALVAMWLLGHRSKVIGTSIALLAALGLYVVYMNHRGLPVVPSSVLIKSDVMNSAVTGHGLIDALYRNVLAGLLLDRGQILLVTAVVLMAALLMKSATRQIRAVIGPITVGIVAHLLGGHYGWFYRYEVYAMTLGWFGLLYVAKELPSPLRERWPLLRNLVVVLIGLAYARPYALATIMTPFAARNIYEQQYQMHRLVADFYHLPVAVNDVGLVSYKNKAFVLDLTGLGSEKVRQLIAAGEYGPAQMAQLAALHKVGLVMIYDSWFPAIPDTWKRIAILHDPDDISAALPNVSFYITPFANIAHVYDALAQFKAGLPARVKFETVSASGPVS